MERPDGCRYSNSSLTSAQERSSPSKIINLYLDDPRLAEIRHERGYTYTDVVNVCPEQLPDFENKIKSFYKEHIHYGKNRLR